jgi:hypothetical protein
VCVVNSLMSRFLEQKVHVSLLLNYFREMHGLFDMVDVVSAAAVCALELTIALITLFHLFVVMNASVCEQNCWFEIFCHFSLRWGLQRCRCLSI